MSKAQPELPGAEGPSIPAIEAAAEEYVRTRDKRMKLTTAEIQSKAQLIAVCQDHVKELSKDGEGNFVYRYDDELVILKPGKTNVKVKRAHETEDDDDD